MREYANVIIAIDEAEIQNIVVSYIGRDDRHKNKFNDIVNVIREGLNNRELFKREKIDDKINNVWAMRFFVGQDNDRIYCQQTTFNGKKAFVLSCLLLHKETDENGPREIAEIKKVSNYQYEYKS